jgi:hypothetical protein
MSNEERALKGRDRPRTLLFTRFSFLSTRS